MTRIHSLVFSLLSPTLLLASNLHKAQPRRLVPDQGHLRHAARDMDMYMDFQSDQTNATLKGGFEWHRHGGKGYVRFLLSSSIDDPEVYQTTQTEDKVPIMIGISTCADIKWNQDETALAKQLNKSNLSTVALTSATDNQTRYGSTFYATGVKDKPYTDPTVPNAREWPIDVTMSFGGSNGPKVGWDTPKARTSKIKRLKWTDDTTGIENEQNLRVDCFSWWHEHEASGIWNRPQYYGRKCKLLIPQPSPVEGEGVGENYCITALGSIDDPASFQDQPLAIRKCHKDNYDNQSTALEWPNYFPKANSDSSAKRDGFRFGRNPLELFKCAPYCANSTAAASS